MPEIDELIEAFGLTDKVKELKLELDPAAKQNLLRQFAAQKAVEAKKFFSENPLENKMSRKREDKETGCSVIRVERKNSEDNEEDEENSGKKQYKTYLIAAKGQYIGEGGFGKSKLAICIDPFDDNLSLDIVKIESSNLDPQRRETTILHELGIIDTQKMQRTSQTTKPKKWGFKKNQNNQQVSDHSKYYTVMPYLGRDLEKVLERNELDEENKFDIAIQVALEVYKLHTDKKYAHLDLKPSNMVLRESKPPYEVKLIDFGYASPLTNKFEWPIVGTALYFPGYVRRGDSFTPAKNIRETWETLQSYMDCDVFALKRTLTQEDINSTNPLINLEDIKAKNVILYDILTTHEQIASINRRDTSAVISANLILHKLEVYPICSLSHDDCKSIIHLYEKNKTNPSLLKKIMEAKLEKIYNVNKDYEAQVTAYMICVEHLELENGSVNFDKNLALNIVALKNQYEANKITKDVFENKLQQLIFLHNELRINASSDSIEYIEGIFPNDRETIVANILNAYTSKLNLDCTNITQEDREQMLKTIHSDKPIWQRNAELILLYLGLDNFAKFIKSEDDYNMLLACYNNIEPSENLWNTQQTIVFEYMLKKYATDTLGNIPPNTDFTELQTCYLNFWNKLKQHELYSDEIFLLEEKFAKTLTIQRTYAQIFGKFLTAEFLAQLPNNEIDDLDKLCQEIMLKVPKENRENLNYDQAALIDNLANRTKNVAVALENGITIMESKHITKEVSEMLQKLKTDKTPENKIHLFLAYYGLNNVLPDKYIADNLPILTLLIEDTIGKNQSYETTQKILAMELLQDNAQGVAFVDAADDAIADASLEVFKHYQNTKQEKPPFTEVATAAVKVFQKYNEQKKAGNPIDLKETLLQKLKQQQCKYTQERMANSIQAARPPTPGNEPASSHKPGVI